MSRRLAGLLMFAAASFASSTAFAGPVEQLDLVSINPADPSQMVVAYRYGGGGMFVTRDGGKKFGWLCSGAISPTAVNRNGRTFVAGDGSIYLGLFDGLMKGNADGCGFAAVPELDKKYIADLAGDPIDPKRTYVVTTNPMMDNFIHVNDGSGTFKPMGVGVQQFLDTLDVVKIGDAGRRYYVTGVLTNRETNEVKYSVRVSEDEAMTWTEEPFDMAQFPPVDMVAEFGIVAINPQNPDHLIGRIWRKQAVDTLVYSTEKGKAGSWKLLGEPTEAEAVAFTPEGVLYYGDSDQKTKSLYIVDKVGDAPRMLTDSWKPQCLGYDTAQKRMLGCSNFYLFGNVDLQTGALTPLLDLRCAEHFVECPGQEATSAACEPQALQDFCHVTHWVIAPLCTVYDRGDDLATYQDAQSIMCVDGFGVSKPEPAAGGAAGGGAAMAAPSCSAGAPCSSAAGAQAVSTAGAGTSAAPPTPPPSGGGCSALAGAQGAGSSYGLWSLGALAAAACWRRRRRA